MSTFNNSDQWEVIGYDTFDRNYYPFFNNKFSTQEEAEAYAAEMRADIERTQPKESAGSIQDKVFVKRPDGSMYRQ